MNFAKRALLYMLRKKGKTVSLFSLIFIVAVFLLSCFGILKASERLSEDIRTSLGAAFYIRANPSVSMNENGETTVKEKSIHISQKEIDRIMERNQVKYCNPVNYGFAKSPAMYFIPGYKHTAENNMGKVTALRYSALAPDFTDETAVLAEGKHIIKEDTGKILISQQLANRNQLSVGDSLTLTHARLGESGGAYIDEIPVKTAYVQVEVSGIYKLKTLDPSVKPTAGMSENKIYASLDVLNKLHESEEGIYTGEVDFYITDPAKLNSIIRNVYLLSSIDWTTHFIRANDFQYSKIADQLSSLNSLVKILLVLVSAVSTAVLTLMLQLRMRGRRQEAGILLAEGISKPQITAGFLLEVLITAIAALILSYMVSLGVTNFLGHQLFDNLPSNLIQEETLLAGGQSRIPIESYLKLGGMETLLIYVCQLVVIIASTFVSSMMIMRLKPKEILSKIS